MFWNYIMLKSVAPDIVLLRL